MAQKVLEINVAYAQDLKDVNLFTKMDVYVVVSIIGGTSSNIRQKTNVDRDSGTHPTWNFPMRFTIDELLAQQGSLTLFFKLKCERSLGDTDIGEVCVPVKDLLDSSSLCREGKSSKFVHYQVTKPSGRGQGMLTFSYKFLEKVDGAQTVEPVERDAEATQQPAAYPPLPLQQPMESSLNYCGMSGQDNNNTYRPNSYPQTNATYPSPAITEQGLGSGYMYPPAPAPAPAPAQGTYMPYSYPQINPPNSYPALPEQVFGSGYVCPPAPALTQFLCPYRPPLEEATGIPLIYPPPSEPPNYAYAPYQHQQQHIYPPTYPPQPDPKYGYPPQAYPGNPSQV